MVCVQAAEGCWIWEGLSSHVNKRPQTQYLFMHCLIQRDLAETTLRNGADMVEEDSGITPQYAMRWP